MEKPLKCNDCQNVIDFKCLDCRFSDKSYWDSIADNIRAKRTPREHSLYEAYFISLSEDEQKEVQSLMERESLDMAKEMGFKLDSFVKNLVTNEIFYVHRVKFYSTPLDIDNAVFTLYKVDDTESFSISSVDRKSLLNDSVRAYSFKRVLNRLDESRDRFNVYVPLT